MKNLLTIIIILLVFATSSCSVSYRMSGYVPSEKKLSTIVFGQTTPEEIKTIFSSPSHISEFNPNRWYYINKVIAKAPVFKPQLVEVDLLEVVFNDENTLEDIFIYHKEDGYDVVTSVKETASAGQALSFWEQLLGNFGRVSLETE